ncbi:MAG: DUF4258 domain-containing protein [Deltaproteobacteria bacterium]|nr:DUF4258 domain-containing protein [Deltaproteobacteria bacterium]
MDNYIFTQHALFEMERRGLSRETVEEVIKNPEQQWSVKEGRTVLQSRVSMGISVKSYLVRVFVDVDRNPPEVVTAYKTSKIEKYWRQEK